MPITVTIELTDEGQVNVGASTPNKVVILGMLEFAKIAFTAPKPKLVEPVPAGRILSGPNGAPA